MANPPAAPGYGKRSSSKASNNPAAKLGSGKQIARKQPAAGTGSPASNPPTDRARVLVSCARVLVES